jgi:hypothetical protein
LLEPCKKKHGGTDSGTVSNVNSHGPLVHAMMSNTLRVTLNAAILIFGLLGSDPQDDVRRDIPIPGNLFGFRGSAYSTTTYTTNNVCICIGN